MEHNLCRENLSAYYDGELPPQERAALEAHLANCPECRAELAQLGAVSKMVKTHGLEPVPPALKEAVLGAPRPAPRPWLKPVLALSTAAAGVLIMLHLTKTPDEVLSPALGFSARQMSGMAMSAPDAEPDKSYPAPAAGQAGPSTEGAAASSGLFQASGQAVIPGVAATRGSYAQAKFAGARVSDLSAGGAGGTSYKSEAPAPAAEFRGPVWVYVSGGASRQRVTARMVEELTFLEKTGTPSAAAEPGNLVFIKKDGTRKTLTEKDCSLGFIFFDGVKDPYVVTDSVSITSQYTKYFGVSSPQ
ncbi:MAG TPA: hypothetical protein DEQ38_07875 [Elusimicrobia bacterium]|nr:MAG: hypothetical protein A2089_06260 [Elusimicrobia bacterium GWD2_63_28]HCC48014.1 hypothetical protein [Elusimicrobiota bacterium]